MVGFFNGIAMGAGVVVARYYGARQIDRLQRANPYGCCLRDCRRYFADDHRSDPRTADAGLDGHTGRRPANSLLYFRIYFMGSLAFVLYNVFVGILQSIGDSRHPSTT